MTEASFVDTTSRPVFTAEQLYSTASYQAKNLGGIGLDYNNLTAWDFNGQNLSNAYLSFSTLTNANLTESDLTNANLTGAVVTGASFVDTTSPRFHRGAALLDSPATQAKNLGGIGLGGNDLTGWDFQRTEPHERPPVPLRTLANANLTGADLTNAELQFSTLTNAKLAGVWWRERPFLIPRHAASRRSSSMRRPATERGT